MAKEPVKADSVDNASAAEKVKHPKAEKDDSQNHIFEIDDSRNGS